VPLAKNLLEDCVETLEEGSYVKGLGEFVLKCINEGKAEFQNCNSRRAGITCYCDENMARFFRESFVSL
jgi:hypothetical protein